MESKGRTQVERSYASKAALIAAARSLFAERGFADVGTGEIVAAAGLTRGALYHQFGDKQRLFVAVLEQVEQEMTDQIAAVLQSGGDPLQQLVDGADAWLDACADTGVQQIVLVDGPAVLGWQRWREIGQRYGLGLTRAALEHAIAAGALPAQPVAPLAHVLIGALDEAALFVSRADDPELARAQMRQVLRRLVQGLR